MRTAIDSARRPRSTIRGNEGRERGLVHGIPKAVSLMKMPDSAPHRERGVLFRGGAGHIHRRQLFLLWRSGIVAYGMVLHRPSLTGDFFLFSNFTVAAREEYVA